MHCNLRQIARVGPSSTQRASTQGCCVGPHDLQAVGWLPNEMLVVAHHANALALADVLELAQSR